jgi:ABC-type dipeptide/oligopeptide/nickel transport system permease subunit
MEGGLLNAIVGSIIMTVIGVGIGAPLGVFAGTYLAEYGKHDKLTSVIRFINDILLSAPRSSSACSSTARWWFRWRLLGSRRRSRSPSS